MAYSDIKKPSSIRHALQEFDQKGRDQFLSEYGFGKSRVYFLKYSSKFYDSKAIVAVAHKYEFPKRGALSPQEE